MSPPSLSFPFLWLTGSPWGLDASLSEKPVCRMYLQRSISKWFPFPQIILMGSRRNHSETFFGFQLNLPSSSQAGCQLTSGAEFVMSDHIFQSIIMNTKLWLDTAWHSKTISAPFSLMYDKIWVSDHWSPVFNKRKQFQIMNQLLSGKLSYMAGSWGWDRHWNINPYLQVGVGRESGWVIMANWTQAL